MIYLDYEMYRIIYLDLQEKFNNVLMEKERLFTKTQPNAIRYDKEKVQVPVGFNVMEEYVISLDEKKIDEQLNGLRQVLDDREKLLIMKEKELRKSQDKNDRIYVYRYLDGYGINRIARSLSYSKSQVYRILGDIKKRCDKMRNNL